MAAKHPTPWRVSESEFYEGKFGVQSADHAWVIMPFRIAFQHEGRALLRMVRAVNAQSRTKGKKGSKK